MNLFCYGTLMSGHARNHMLTRMGATYLGPFKTEPKFTMISHKAFPAVLTGGSTQITGEVYGIDEAILKLCDAIEGYPQRFYDRMELDTEYGKAWMYYQKNNRFDSEIIPDGVWRGV